MDVQTYIYHISGGGGEIISLGRKLPRATVWGEAMSCDTSIMVMDAQTSEKVSDENLICSKIVA